MGQASVKPPSPSGGKVEGHRRDAAEELVAERLQRASQAAVRREALNWFVAASTNVILLSVIATWRTGRWAYYVPVPGLVIANAYAADDALGLKHLRVNGHVRHIRDEDTAEKTAVPDVIFRGE